MNIKTTSFGFPVNRTVELDYDNIVLPFFDSVNLKAIIHLTPEQKKNVKDKDIEEKLREQCPQIKNIKIVYDVDRTQNVRSKKIVEAESISDKLTEYFSVNKIEAPEGVFDKAKTLEENLSIEHFSPSHSFRLLSIKLRGAIGIKKGSGKDEIEVNFEDYNDGIIALIGENGKGKTTLLENCHPFPKMLTRDGKLQDHFFLKDSYRKLLYVDENDTYYEIIMNIDGFNKTGKVTYFVNTGKDRNALEPIKDLSGTIDPYTTWVNQTFGSLNIFLQTAFFAKEQTDAPDIAHSTKGQKKELFSTLLGIDYLSILEESARAELRNSNQKMNTLKTRLEGIHYDDEELATLQNTLEVLNEDSKRVSAEMKDAEKLVEELKEKEKLEANTSDIEEEIRKLSEEFKVVTKDRNTVSEYLLHKTEYDEFEKTFSEIDTLTEKMNFIKTTRLADAEEAYKKAENEINSKQREIDSLEGKISLLKENLVLEVDDKCPTCNQTLPADEIKALEEKVNTNKATISENENLLIKLKSDLEILEKDLETLSYVDIKDEVKTLNEDIMRKQLSVARVSRMQIIQEKSIYDAIHDKETLDERYNSLFDKLSEKRDVLEQILNNREEGLHEKLEEALKLVGVKSLELLDIAKNIGMAESQIETLEKNHEEMNSFKGYISDLSKEIACWEILEKAFGPNGIQALELEAFAPDVAEITNNILAAAYGDKFKISFQTLRIGTTGQLIEDFNILVENTNDGSVEPLEWLSSGEAIWIKEALYNAFSIIREKSTRFSFRTKFLDESDGSLDSKARLMYYKMIELAHKECDTCQTIIITHSSELKDIIENKIEL